MIKNISGIFELEILTSFPYSGINIAPAVVDIDSDGKPELFVGSRTGGLQYFEMDEELSINSQIKIPQRIVIHDNYPNPFNPITCLRYDLPEQAQVTLTVYDMLGREVAQLVNTIQESGYKSVQWDATDHFGKLVSAGVYLYRIQVRQKDGGQAGEFLQTRKMVLLK